MPQAAACTARSHACALIAARAGSSAPSSKSLPMLLSAVWPLSITRSATPSMSWLNAAAKTVWPLSITRSATPSMSLLNAAAKTRVRVVATRACDHDREALHFGTYRSELRHQDGRIAQALGHMDRSCRVRTTSIAPRHVRRELVNELVLLVRTGRSGRWEPVVQCRRYTRTCPPPTARSELCAACVRRPRLRRELVRSRKSRVYISALSHSLARPQFVGGDRWWSPQPWAT